MEWRHYLDTLFPFVNSPARSAIGFFRDGSLDLASDFQLDVQARWRWPRFFWLGLRGRGDRSNILAVFENRGPAGKRRSARQRVLRRSSRCGISLGPVTILLTSRSP